MRSRARQLPRLGDERAARTRPPRCTRRWRSRSGVRIPSMVEWAPGPNPSHSPSVQYFRLCRDCRPGRATFEISYCSIPGRVQPRHRLQVHLRRRRRRAPPTTARAPSRREAARWDRSRACRATRARGRRAIERVHRLEPLRHRLLRQPHHQVEREVVEAGRARFAHRRRRRGDAECSRREAHQFVVAERLHAEAETVDAGGAEARQPLGGHRLRGWPRA